MTQQRIQSPRQQYDQHYLDFQANEGIPVHTGLYVDDVRTVNVDRWARTGGRGAFLNVDGMEDICDAQVHEIPPGEELKPQRHLPEALVYVVGGNGWTTIGSGDDQQTFEWSTGSLFFLPHNTWYKHANAHGDEPARLLAVTSLPLYYNLFRSGSDAVIWDLDCYDGWSDIASDDYYASVAELETADDTRTYWNSNFIPDARSFDNLASWSLRGDSNSSVFFPFMDSPMDSHISEFESGRYKKAHRHISGANILLLSGEGYTLLWRENDDERVRVDWDPYTFFAPPTMCFHQHFNVSAEPARYIVFHGAQQRLGMQLYRSSDGNDPLPVHQVEYYEEDPEIRATFERELADRGIESQMTDDLYAAP